MSQKQYEVIKDFKGSPDGHTILAFTKGEEVEHDKLGDDLVKVALDEKWIKTSKAAEKRAKEEAEAKLKAEAAAKAKADAIAALESTIAQLKTDFDAATDEAVKAKILAEAEAKQVELDALLQ